VAMAPSVSYYSITVFHPDVASSVAVAVRDAATQQLDR